MKFVVANWGFCHKEIEALGYHLDDRVSAEIEGDLWEHAKKIFDSGLNVMLQHRDKASTILWVDNKRFSVR